MRGRKRKPKRGRRHKLTAPIWLTALAREEWDRVAHQLEAMGIAAPIDEVTVAAYCECFSRWRTAEEIIRVSSIEDPAKGLLGTTANGTSFQAAIVGIANAARKDLLKFAAELGLTPTSRARFDAVPMDPSDTAANEYGLE